MIDPAAYFDPLLASKGVLLAVSGGKDSTALMVLAARWRDRLDRPVAMHVATIDHGLRPEAVAETDLVARNAETLGLNCIILKAGLEGGHDRSGGNVQARARQARYECLVAAARDTGCDTIVTAHHRDDQAETFLIRLARGSGAYGLGAMRHCVRLDELNLVRPFLDVDKTLLHRIADESGLACVDDPSNRDLAFNRIRWRTMLPQLAEAGATSGRIAETAKRMQRAADALDHYAGEVLRSHVSVDAFGSATVRALMFKDVPEEIQLRAFARLLQIVRGSDYTPRLDRLEQLLRAVRVEIAGSGSLRRTLNGCVIDLKSGQFCVYREWGRAGPGQVAAISGDLVWDGRFVLNLPPDLPDGIVAAPLGNGFRDLTSEADPKVLRTVPGLFAGNSLFALPRIGHRDKSAEPGRFTCRSLAAGRLLNPGTNHADTLRARLC